MLRKIRIEVTASSAAEVVCDLDKYEHALHAAEAERYGLGYTEGQTFRNWGVSVAERDFYNDQLGRVITEEVIEFVDEGDGDFSYKGRRVVAYRRLDGREVPSVVPSPRVVDHHEDRSEYPDPPEAPMIRLGDTVDEKRLRGSTDAQVWAQEFRKVHPEVGEGLLIGWFADAIETARIMHQPDPPEDPPTGVVSATGRGRR